MHLSDFCWICVFSYAIACIKDRFFCKDRDGYDFFSLKDRILWSDVNYLQPTPFESAADEILAYLFSSSSASFIVNVLGDPLLLVKSDSVISCWKDCFFLCPDPYEYCVLDSVDVLLL